MNIENLKQLGLGYHDQITITAYMIPAFAETNKATFIKINQPDGRKKEYNIAVKLYNCSNITLIDTDDIVSISEGW